MNNVRPADWYVDQWDPTFLRWWSGEAWTDHYIPNVAYPQPNLPRSIPKGKRLGYKPKTRFSETLQAIPGWYEDNGFIRWWDGVSWTELRYPKRLGVNLGGGDPTGYLVTFTITLLALLPLTFATVEDFLSERPLFGAVFGAVLFGDAAVAFLVKANLKHMESLRNLIHEHGKTAPEKLRGS